MTLTTEQIDVLYMRTGLGKFHQPVDSLQCEYDHCIHDFARAVEAEVRKQDTELIRQMLEALETYQAFIDDAHIIDGQWHWLDAAKPAIAAAKQRLEPKP